MSCDFDRCPRCNSHVRVDEDGSMSAIRIPTGFNESMRKTSGKLLQLVQDLKDFKRYLNEELASVREKIKEDS